MFLDKIIYYLYFNFFDAFRKKIRNRITMVYVKKKAGALGSNFAVGKGAKVRGISKNIIIRNNVQTNGISFLGAGKVVIGN